MSYSGIRWWAKAAFLGAMTLCVVPAQAVTYTIKDLGTGWRPDGINDSGAVVGTMFGQGGSAEVVRWSGGCTINCLSNFGSFGNGWAIAKGINNLGQIVGTFRTSDSAEHAFTYNMSSFTDLGTLGGRHSSASGINNLGQIVGQSYLDTGGYTGFIYKDGAMQDLGVSQVFYQSQATGINDAGLVIGMAHPQFGQWTLGMTIDTANGNALTTINPPANGPGIALTAVNGAGAIVGYTYGAVPQAFTYDHGTITPLPGNPLSQAFDNNDRGQSVGYAAINNNYGLYLNDGQNVTMWHDLIGQGTGWSMSAATGESFINNAGQIVGVANYGGETHVFLMTPNETPKVPPIIPPSHENIHIDGLSEFDPTKPTVIITHGWQPPGSGDPHDWMDGANGMKGAIDAATSNGANVLRVYWDDAQTNFLSANALKMANAGTVQAGNQLAEQLYAVLSQSTQGIQFIGHSLGTYVNAYAANELANRGITIQQFTILDRPLGNGNYLEGLISPPAGDFDSWLFQKYLPKDKVIWVDNYYGNSQSSIPPATGSSFGGKAVAFDHLYIGAGHSDVHDLYAATISANSACSDQGGFGCSIIGGGYDQRPEGRFWDPTLNFNVPVATSVNFASPNWSANNCAVQSSNSVTCSEGSPAYFWDAAFSLEADSLYLQFELEWLNQGDGDWLSVFFENELLFSNRGNSLSQSRLLDSGFVQVSHIAGQTGQLLFMLNSVGERNASIKMDNLRVYRNASAVPEPETYIMLILGFAICGAFVRKMDRLETVYAKNP
jgi:probable HAF family extracellular repeat protein